MAKLFANQPRNSWLSFSFAPNLWRRKVDFRVKRKKKTQPFLMLKTILAHFSQLLFLAVSVVLSWLILERVSVCSPVLPPAPHRSSCLVATTPA